MDLRVPSYTSIMKGYATRYCVLECNKFHLFYDATKQLRILSCTLNYYIYIFNYVFSLVFKNLYVRHYKSYSCSTYFAKHRHFVPNLEIMKYYVLGYTVLSRCNTTHTTNEILNPFNCGYCK